MEVPPTLDPPPAEAELIVLRPDGTLLRRLALSGERVTVGRLPERNDVALEPDAELLVSRAAHCTLEQVDGRWSVVDGGSVNGTYLRREGRLERVRDRLELRDGDVVSVLASVTPTGERRFFELAFRSITDPLATRAAPLSSGLDGGVTDVDERTGGVGCLVYERHGARLVLVQGDARHEIRLRPQGHRLVAFMAAQNAASGGVPALCTHEELMRAVWEDEPLHSRLELARLVWELRRELRPFGAEQLVESERRRGYRLRTCTS